MKKDVFSKINPAKTGRRFVLAIVLLVAVGCGDSGDSQFREKADAALGAGNVDEAADLYRQAIEANPEEAYAYGRLGQILARQNNGIEALTQLDKAIELDPDWALPNIEKVRLLLARGDAAAAEAHAKAFTAHDAENGAILQAYVMRRDQRIPQAIDLLEEQVAANESSAVLRINLAMNLLAADRPQDAETHLKEVLDSIDPNSTAARVCLMEAYRVQGRLDDIAAEYEQRVAQNPGDEAAKLALALVKLDTGEQDAALELARSVAEATPDSGWAHYVLGACYLATGDRSNAVQHLETANRLLPEDTLVAQRLAMAKAGSVSQTTASASPTSSTPVTAAPGAEPAVGWRALWNHARLGELLERRAEFAADGDPDLANVLVMSALFVANLELARELVEEVPEESPVRPYFHAFEALAGDLTEEQARERLVALRGVLENWPAEDDDLKHLKMLAEAYAMSSIRLRAEAFGLYHTCLQQFPANGVPLRNLAMMYSTAEMPEFAASAMRRLMDVHGNVPELRGLFYQICTRGDLDDQAVSFAEATYSAYPTEPEPVATLARLYLRTGEIGGALRVLQAAQTDLPNEEPLKVLYAGALVRNGQIEEALAELEEANIPPELETTAAEVRAFCHAGEGAWQAVESTLQALDPNALSGGGQLLLAAAKAHLNKRDEAVAALPDTGPLTALTQTLTRVLGSGGDVTNPREAALADTISRSQADAAKYVYAMACRGSQLYGKAFELLRELHLKYPDQPQLMAHALDVLSRADTIEDRSTVAETLTKDKPDMPEAWAGLAAVYGADGDIDAQGEALRQAVQRAPERIDLLQQLVVYANAQNDNELALETYRRLLPLQPENPSTLNNYAYYLLETGGSAAEAERHAQKALDILPSNPNVIHTLGLAQFEQGKIEEASQNLARALRMRPGDPTLSFDYGRLLIRQGQDEQGLGYVRMALTFAQNLGLNFPRQDEAVALLTANRPAAAPPA